MTLLGFSLACGIFSTLFLNLYSQELSIARSEEFKWFSMSSSEEVARIERRPIGFSARDKEQHALVGSIYGFVVVELILAMWSVGMCLVTDQQQVVSEDEPVSVVIRCAPEVSLKCFLPYSTYKAFYPVIFQQFLHMAIKLTRLEGCLVQVCRKPFSLRSAKWVVASNITSHDKYTNNFEITKLTEFGFNRIYPVTQVFTAAILELLSWIAQYDHKGKTSVQISSNCTDLEIVSKMRDG